MSEAAKRLELYNGSKGEVLSFTVHCSFLSGICPINYCLYFTFFLFRCQLVVDRDEKMSIIENKYMSEVKNEK